MADALKIGIAGLGTVGSSLVRILGERANELARTCGRPITITAVSARDKSRDRGVDLSAIQWFDSAVEMANTADRLVVIGKGKLITSTTVAEFVGRSGADTVRVRSPELDTLRRVLTDAGLTAEADHGAALVVRGAAIEVIGELAARNAITLHELSEQRGSLEEAYMELTDEVTEYRAVTR